MKPHWAGSDSVDLQRRGLLKGALCAAAASVVAPGLLWASPSPDSQHYLLIQGTLAPEASHDDLARITLPKLASTQYIEFDRHAAIFQQRNPKAGQPVAAWLPFNSPLFTPEDPYVPISPASVGPIPLPYRRFSGLLMNDGSPASIIMAAGGYPGGLRGAEKAGPNLAIQISVSKTPFGPGRNATNQLSAVVASAAISSGPINGTESVPDLLFTLSYEPARARVTLALAYKKVQSMLMATCGLETLLRTATYDGQSFCNQPFKGNAGGTAFGIALAPNPVSPAIGRIAAFTPALSTVSQHIPYGAPMQMLSGIDIEPNESEPAFVQRATDAVTDLLPAMAACMCEPSDSSIATLARWLGWNIVAEASSLQGAFADAYQFAKAYSHTHHPGGPVFPFHKIPQVMDSGYDSDAPEPESRDNP